MDIKNELRAIEGYLKSIEVIRDRVKDAAETTASILAACEKLGVDIVGIGKKHKDIKGSIVHPFGASGSVFAGGYDASGFPIAWSIVRVAGVSGGCGNPGQHQVAQGTKMLDGVYRCIGGMWSRDD